MTTKQDAIEAAAIALCIAEGYPADSRMPNREQQWTTFLVPAQAAVQAYLAAREAEGWKFTRITADD